MSHESHEQPFVSHNMVIDSIICSFFSFSFFVKILSYALAKKDIICSNFDPPWEISPILSDIRNPLPCFLTMNFNFLFFIFYLGG